MKIVNLTRHNIVTKSNTYESQSPNFNVTLNDIKIAMLDDETPVVKSYYENHSGWGNFETATIYIVPNNLVNVLSNAYPDSVFYSPVLSEDRTYTKKVSI